MYEFIRGPLAWACFSIFIAGMIFQVARFFIITKIIQPVRLTPPAGYKKKKSRLSRESLPSFAAKVRVSVAGVNPVMTAVTVLFHVSIIILPVFLMEHNMLMDTLWGISFCPCVLSETNADILAGITLSCILFFLSRRIFISRIRSISTFYDYFIILLAASPFVTGLLAIHDLFDYRTLIILHVMSVNIIMISLPFTKFVHSIFFFLNRFFIGSETSFATGSRKW
jgi:nitrate reductase gamma subunit